MDLTCIVCKIRELIGHIFTSCAVAFWEMSLKSNENINISHYLFVSFLFISPVCLFVLLQDGSGGRSSRKKGRLQPAVWHLGCGHHCYWTGWTTTPHVWLAPHEVEQGLWLSNIKHKKKVFLAIWRIKGCRLIPQCFGYLSNSCVGSQDFRVFSSLLQGSLLNDKE